MSQGLATSVANGSATITVTHTPTGLTTTVPVTVSTLLYLNSIVLSGPTAVTTGQDSTAYTAAGFDQLGAPFTFTPIFASSVTAKVTINSSTGVAHGVADGTSDITAHATNSLGTLITSNAITLTASAAVNFDTKTYNATTGVGIGGSNGAVPITKAWDAASKYAADSNFRAQIANFNTSPGNRPTWIFSNQSLNGTGSYNSNEALSCRYDDGRYVDLATWQNSVQYMGDPAIEMLIPGVNDANPSPTANLVTRIPSTVTKNTWIWIRRRYQNFSSVGDANSANGGAAFNTGTNAAFKLTPWAIYTPSGRGGPTSGNGSGNTAQLFGENSPGLTESLTGYSVSAEWGANGDWYDWLVKLNQVTGANGNIWSTYTVWNRKQGDAHFTQRGVYLTADSGASTSLFVSEFYGLTGANYNQSRLTDLKYHAWGWAAFDSDNPNNDGSNDPFGVLAYQATLTPENPGTNLTKTSQNSTSATFSVTTNRFTGYLRPYIDGVATPAQDFAIPVEHGEDTVLTGIVVNLSSGTHTVKFRALSGDKSASSASDTNTVTGIVIP